MKSTLVYSAFCLISILVFFGCTKNTMEEHLLVTETKTAMQLSTVNEQGITLETVSVTPCKDISTPNAQSRSNPNQIATGDYETVSGNHYVFSAIKNNGGIHGEWEITASFGHYIVETICVSTNEEDGTAMIAGIITEVLIPGTLSKNQILFFKAKDNGEGANSPPDQTSSSFGVYLNWFLFYNNSVDEFLVDINCTDPPAELEALFGPYGDRIGQIQVQ